MILPEDVKAEVERLTREMDALKAHYDAPVKFTLDDLANGFPPTQKNYGGKASKMATIMKKKAAAIGQVVYNVTLTLTERMLGTAPKDKEVYANYIASKRPDGPDHEELETIEQAEERGWTGFHRDPKSHELFLYDYQARGFFKEQGDSLRECGAIALKGIRRKIDRFVFIRPRRIYFLDEKGKRITKPDDLCERPLRAQTMQGERVSLARSDVIAAGRRIQFEIVVMWPDVFTEEVLRAILSRGEFMGLGQWRTGGNGLFTYELQIAP